MYGHLLVMDSLLESFAVDPGRPLGLLQRAMYSVDLCAIMGAPEDLYSPFVAWIDPLLRRQALLLQTQRLRSEGIGIAKVPLSCPLPKKSEWEGIPVPSHPITLLEQPSIEEFSAKAYDISQPVLLKGYTYTQIESLVELICSDSY